MPVIHAMTICPQSMAITRCSVEAERPGPSRGEHSVRAGVAPDECDQDVAIRRPAVVRVLKQQVEAMRRLG